VQDDSLYESSRGTQDDNGLGGRSCCCGGFAFYICFVAVGCGSVGRTFNFCRLFGGTPAAGACNGPAFPRRNSRHRRIKVEPPVSWPTRLRMISARAVVELDGPMDFDEPAFEAAYVAHIP